MRYTTEQAEKIVAQYNSGIPVKDIAAELGVPERSVIAKLSSLGVYKRKEYLNKRGEPPIKKEEYINRIAALLDINIDLLESMEKVTKSALVLMDARITELKKPD